MTALRVLLGLLSPVAGFVAGTFFVAALGGPMPLSVALCLMACALGLLGLDLTRSASAEWRPLRLCLSIPGLLTLYH